MTSRFVGTATLETSTSNQEIIPLAPIGWSDSRYTFKKFSFINKMPCIVKINGSGEIFLDTEQGFDFSGNEVESFVIVTPNVQYSYIGEY